MTTVNQAVRDENIRAIVAFFESGVECCSQRLGIELEHTLVHDDGTPVSYSEPHGVRWLLEQLKEAYPQATYDDEGDILGVARPGSAVTIEPASQVELSAGPFATLDDARRCFDAFERKLAARLDPHGIRVLATGYHPSSKAADLELIPKRRYELMNAYLGGISPFGVCMMRGSASTQVSIDYSSVDDCLRKLRIAFAAVPLISLMCDNSPVFEDAPRTHHMVRTEIWQHCDPDRCGIVPGVMDPAFTLADYAAYVLDTPAILAPTADGTWEADARTFGEIYATRPMEKRDVEHALSMFFTDVRLKTYIEIRPADAMPVPYAIAYAALVKGMFYCEESLAALDELFAGVTEQMIADAKASLMERGYAGEVYGRPAGELADKLVEIAHDGLDEDERSYLEPLARLVEARTTLADL